MTEDTKEINNMPAATCSICFEELLCASNPTAASKYITNTLNTTETPKALSKHSSTNSLASTATASTTTGCGAATTTDTTYAESPSAPPESPLRPSTSTSRNLSVVTENSNVGEDGELVSPNSLMSVSATPCGHVFHTMCVAKWIDQHKHCPTCRQPVLTSSRLVKLFLAEDKMSASAMVLYGNSCGATAVRQGYERHPSWIGLQNNNNMSKLGGFGNKNSIPLFQRPHSIVGSSAMPHASRLSPLGASGGGHWSSQRGDVNVEETRIIMDVMQCQMEDLEGECQNLRKSLLTVEDQLQTKVEEVSALEARVSTKRRSTSMSEEPDVATTSQNLAIAMLAAGPSEAAESSPVLEGKKRRRASSISNIQQTLLELRREYDNLQTVSHDLRGEIQDLNDSILEKGREMCSKDQRIFELEERNRRLTEDIEANSRLTSDLRVIRHHDR